MHATYFVMAPLFRLGRWQEIPPLLDEHLAAFAEETVDMNCPYTRGGPVIGAVVLDQLGRTDDAKRASESIVPNDHEPGTVEAWMAERALPLVISTGVIVLKTRFGNHAGALHAERLEYAFLH